MTKITSAIIAQKYTKITSPMEAQQSQSNLTYDSKEITKLNVL